MPRTALSIQDIVATGLTPAYTSANAAGHSVSLADGERVFIQVKNADSSGITVTCVTGGTVRGVAIADVTVSVGANTGDKMIGPFPQYPYAQTDGTLSVDFSAVTSVTCAAFRLPAPSG